MGPKKNPHFEDVDDLKKSIDDLKKSIDDLITEVSAVKKQQEEILKLVADVKALRQANEEKDRRISQLESRVADREQYTRINGMIVTPVLCSRRDPKCRADRPRCEFHRATGSCLPGIQRHCY